MEEQKKISETFVRAHILFYALPLFTFMVLYAEWTLILLFAVLSLLGFREFLKLVDGKTARGIMTPWFFPVPVVLSYLPFTGLVSGSQLTVWWYVFVLWLVFWGLLCPESARDRIASFTLGTGYCVVLPTFWVRAGLEVSRVTVVVFGLVIWCSDIGAYLVGSHWGRRRFVPAISPRKTLEGLLGGMIAAGIAGMVFTVFFFQHRSVWEGLAIGLVLALIAFLGDLFESSLKRKAGVKDSGNLFPGHGGILDRFDAFFLAGPAIYFIARYWGGIS